MEVHIFGRAASTYKTGVVPSTSYSVLLPEDAPDIAYLPTTTPYQPYKAILFVGTTTASGTNVGTHRSKVRRWLKKNDATHICLGEEVDVNCVVLLKYRAVGELVRP